MTNITHNYFVERIGQGEPTIFLPAGGFCGNEGLNIAEYLSDNFETHLIDLPGLGKSNSINGKITSIKFANWVKEYLTQQQIEKANLIGHSLGGAILLAFAVHYPDKVNKLVLLDQGHKPFPRIPKSEFGTLAYLFPLLNIGAKVFGKPFLNKLAPLFTQDNEQEEDFEANLKQFCERVGIKENEYVRLALKNQANFSADSLNLMFGYYNLNLPKLLKSLKVTTYLVYGTFKDKNGKEHKTTNQYIKNLKQFNLPITYLPINGGHYVHWNEEFSLYNLKRFLTYTS